MKKNSLTLAALMASDLSVNLRPIRAGVVEITDRPPKHRANKDKKKKRKQVQKAKRKNRRK